MLLQKNSTDDDMNDQGPNEKAVKKQAKECISQIHFFIGVIVTCLTRFYAIEVKPMGNDLKKDLLVNLVTNFVLADDIYFLIFNLMSVTEQRKLQKLTTVIHNQKIIDT